MKTFCCWLLGLAVLGGLGFVGYKYLCPLAKKGCDCCPVNCCPDKKPVAGKPCDCCCDKCKDGCKCGNGVQCSEFCCCDNAAKPACCPNHKTCPTK